MSVFVDITVSMVMVLTEFGLYGIIQCIQNKQKLTKGAKQADFSLQSQLIRSIISTLLSLLSVSLRTKKRQALLFLLQMFLS
jgi:glucose-6-phosphate isomerase